MELTGEVTGEVTMDALESSSTTGGNILNDKEENAKGELSCMEVDAIANLPNSEIGSNGEQLEKMGNVAVAVGGEACSGGVGEAGLSPTPKSPIKKKKKSSGYKNLMKGMLTEPSPQKKEEKTKEGDKMEVDEDEEKFRKGLGGGVFKKIDRI